MSISQNFIDSLIDKTSKGPKLSFYIPTHPKSSSEHLEEDRIRFKNALQEVKDVARKDHSGLNKVYKDLENLKNDTDFWKHQSLSLAVFADQDSYKTVQLPIESKQITLLSDNYYITPLIISNSILGSAYVLDVNLDSPRLLLANDAQINELNEIKLPDALKDVMSEDREDNLQFHAGGNNGAKVPMYHGHGGSDNQKEEEIDLYMQLLAKPLNKYLADKDKVLILAGDETQLIKLKKYLNYKYIHSHELHGNHQRENMDTLQSSVKPVLDEISLNNREEIIGQFNNSTPNILAQNTSAVEAALDNYKVDKLFVPVLRSTTDSVRDGRDENLRIEISDTNKDRIENAIVKTIQQGGEVIPTEIGTFKDDELRALLRY